MNEETVSYRCGIFCRFLWTTKALINNLAVIWKMTVSQSGEVIIQYNPKNHKTNVFMLNIQGQMNTSQKVSPTFPATVGLRGTCSEQLWNTLTV